MRNTPFAIAAIAALALSVAGCSTLQNAFNVAGAAAGFQVTQSQIDAAEASYTALLVFEVNYRCLYDNKPAACADRSGHKAASNPCRAGQHATLTNVCAERGIVVRLQDADKVMNDALDRLQAEFAMCTAGGVAEACRGIGAAYSTATNALAAATALARQFGFRG